MLKKNKVTYLLLGTILLMGLAAIWFPRLQTGGTPQSSPAASHSSASILKPAAASAGESMPKMAEPNCQAISIVLHGSQPPTEACLPDTHTPRGPNPRSRSAWIGQCFYGGSTPLTMYITTTGGTQFCIYGSGYVPFNVWNVAQLYYYGSSYGWIKAYIYGSGAFLNFAPGTSGSWPGLYVTQACPNCGYHS